jgi:hypothetical protein
VNGLVKLQNCSFPTSWNYRLHCPSHIYFILKGFDKDPSFSNYTSANLRRLTEHSLECAPLVNYSFEAPAPELCFPLAVFYVLGTTAGGKATSGITYAVPILKRATGAAVASLSFEGLARFADGKQKSRHIPPVIAVTIAGPMTTVWLAYCKIDNEQTRDKVRCLILHSGFCADIKEGNDTHLG